jgi:transcriptional regulator with XRE-family HTH domain
MHAVSELPAVPGASTDGPGGPERAAARRSQLGEFLKTRRAQVSPDDVGLPPGTRRRTPGLRREEVALLAGVGVTWYTWLEQGRPINASAQVLDAVARTLRLAPAEREHLYRLAEATPVRAATADPPDVAEVLDVLRAIPFPAVLLNSRLDILASNTAHGDLYADWHSLPCVHKNLLWCLITEPRARTRLLTYDEDVPYLVARLRAEYGGHVGDPEWEEDINRLARLSPEFERLWARHEVTESRPRTRVVRHPVAGDLRFSVTELAVASHHGLWIYVSTPADDGTRERLPAIRRSDAPDGYRET